MEARKDSSEEVVRRFLGGLKISIVAKILTLFGKGNDMDEVVATAAHRVQQELGKRGMSVIEGDPDQYAELVDSVVSQVVAEKFGTDESETRRTA